MGDFVNHLAGAIWPGLDPTTDIIAGIPSPPKGVAFAPPPPHLVGGVLAAVQRAVAELPPDKHGAIVTVADLSGVNATVVARVGSGWEIQAYAAKTWRGPLQAEARVIKSW